jgi:hypothetical protein
VPRWYRAKIERDQPTALGKRKNLKAGTLVITISVGYFVDQISRLEWQEGHQSESRI